MYHNKNLPLTTLETKDQHHVSSTDLSSICSSALSLAARLPASLTAIAFSMQSFWL